jgi:hypothetical protein
MQRGSVGAQECLWVTASAVTKRNKTYPALAAGVLNLNFHSHFAGGDPWLLPFVVSLPAKIQPERP